MERLSSATLGTPGHEAGAAGVVAQRHDALYAAAAAKVQERINGLADRPLENVSIIANGWTSKGKCEEQIMCHFYELGSLWVFYLHSKKSDS